MGCGASSSIHYSGHGSTVEAACAALEQILVEDGPYPNAKVTVGDIRVASPRGIQRAALASLGQGGTKEYQVMVSKSGGGNYVASVTV